VFMSNTISLSKAERVELSQRATSQAGRADDARRARLILLLEAGETWPRSARSSRATTRSSIVEQAVHRRTPRRLSAGMQDRSEHAHPGTRSEHSGVDGKAQAARRDALEHA